MATLADKINKNKSMLKRGGGLFEATGETIMSRLKKADMIPGAGTSPLAASAIGAGPDQAKMAGSAAQLQKSIKDTLTKEEKKEPRGLRSILTEEETNRKEKAEKLNNLELLGSRIGGIVNNIIDKANVAIPYELDIQEDVIKADFPELTDENRNSFESILAEITFDADGKPIITEDMLGRANALLPEDKKLESIEDLKKYVVGATIGTLQVNTTKLKETYPDITEEQIAAVKGILTQAGLTEGGKPEDMSAEDLNKVAKLLGITAETRETIIAKIKEFITPITETVVDNITDTLGPTVSLSDFTDEDWQAFGLTGPDDLVGLLGITTAEASELTVGQLQEKVNALLQADYDRVEELTRVANDPFYPENLRKAAQAELRDLSSVGVMATESDFEKLNEAVQSADEIEVAGKTYTVDELLSDEQLTVLISAYLEDPESDFSKELARDLPELQAFITENKVALEAAMKYLDESIQEKIATAKKNDAANVYDTGTGVNIDMSKINAAILGDEYEDGIFVDKTIPDGVFTVGEGDDAVTYNYQANLRGAESELNQEAKITYANYLNTALKEGYTELFEELATMDSGAIAANAKRYGISQKQWIERRYRQVKTNKIFEAGMKDEASAKTALTNVLGKTTEELDEYLTSYDIFKGYGLGGTSGSADILKRSIVLDDKGKINYKATLVKFQQINNGNRAFKEESLAQWTKDTATSLKSKQYSDLFAAVQDGYLTSDEVGKILALPDQKQVDKLILMVQEKNAKGGLIRGAGLSSKVEDYVVNKTRNILKGVFPSSEAAGVAMTASGGLVRLEDTGSSMTYDEIIRTMRRADVEGTPSYVRKEIQRRIDVLEKQRDEYLKGIAESLYAGMGGE